MWASSVRGLCLLQLRMQCYYCRMYHHQLAPPSAAARALGVDVSGVALNGGRPAPDLNISLSIACSFAPVFAWHFMRARQMRARQMRARAHACANLFPRSRIFMRRRCRAQKVMTSAQLDINECLLTLGAHAQRGLR